MANITLLSHALAAPAETHSRHVRVMNSSGHCGHEEKDLTYIRVRTRNRLDTLLMLTYREFPSLLSFDYGTGRDAQRRSRSTAGIIMLLLENGNAILLLLNHSLRLRHRSAAEPFSRCPCGGNTFSPRTVSSKRTIVISTDFSKYRARTRNPTPHSTRRVQIVIANVVAASSTVRCTGFSLIALPAQKPLPLNSPRAQIRNPAGTV